MDSAGSSTDQIDNTNQERPSAENQGNLKNKSRTPVWPTFIVLFVLSVLFAFLTNGRSIGPTWLSPLIVILLLVPLVFSWTQQHHKVTAFIGRAVIVVVTITLIGSVGLLVKSLLAHNVDATALLSDAAILWVSNILIFSLWYWEIDGNGPGERHLNGYTPTDFLFPQILAGQVIPGKWIPSYIDFLFVAFNTSTAFSPTDTAVLSQRAKALMMGQTIISLIVVLMFAARAINILPNQ